MQEFLLVFFSTSNTTLPFVLRHKACLESRSKEISKIPLRNHQDSNVLPLPHNLERGAPPARREVAAGTAAPGGEGEG